MNTFVPPQQRAAWQALQTLADSANPHLRGTLKSAAVAPAGIPQRQQQA